MQLGMHYAGDAHARCLVHAATPSPLPKHPHPTSNVQSSMPSPVPMYHVSISISMPVRAHLMPTSPRPCADAARPSRKTMAGGTHTNASASQKTNRGVSLSDEAAQSPQNEGRDQRVLFRIASWESNAPGSEVVLRMRSGRRSSLAAGVCAADDSPHPLAELRHSRLKNPAAIFPDSCVRLRWNGL